MPTKITSDILESYVCCKFKGHLKLLGEAGSKSDYEQLLAGQREKVRLQAHGKILAQNSMEPVGRATPLTTVALKRGTAFLLDAVFEDDCFLLHFDGLKRIDEPSNLGKFHYIPMLFYESRHIPKRQKLLLELYGLILARLQGRQPNTGLIWHGPECRTTKVRLNASLRDTERVLGSLRQMCADKTEPALLLNDHCHICEFRQRCHVQATKEDHLSLLRGIGSKEIKNYARKGIFTVRQLSHTFRPRRKGKRAEPRVSKRHHSLQALAIRDRTTYVFGSPTLADQPVKIYLDIEAIPEEDFVYLIGLIVDEGSVEKRYSFWADRKEDETTIFERFLAVVCQYETFLVFFYGNYEALVLKRLRKHSDSSKQIDRVLTASINILSIIYAHIYFPTYTNGLKDIGAYLGYSWSEADASGLQSIVWRANWEASQDNVWKQKLTAYNMDDCAALKAVVAQVYSIISRPQQVAEATIVAAESRHVAHVEEIDRLSRTRTWGLVNYVHPDYAYINKCGYFDYQRRRVYVRSLQSRRRRTPKAGVHQNRRLRVTIRLEIVASKCPRCQSRDIVRLAKRQFKGIGSRIKRAFDLTITSSGIRRRVIECRSPVHECQACQTKFLPSRYERLAKHFHGLKSWAMYQHVAHNVSFGALELMFREFFGLALPNPEIHAFKELMARYYRATYKRMLAKILSGSLLHVDETAVKLKKTKGYVWVFTNLEDVIFMYRPTRDAAFLRDLLKDFRGVLVSDFYSAYDSFECPQQKCLIHLMRDMNQDLLNNPFNQELLSITEPFGVLLRSIVTDVDKHGLRKSHLSRHQREVDKYFQSLSSHAFQSDAAESLRERIMRNRDKLFTFIRYDGIPWNNNNAENAIKRFAYYRAETAGTMREDGLTDYLTLLSICHTCRYKGVSFLKFLLSREKDVDTFVYGKRRKRRRQTIEVYPKGYISPLFKKRHRAGAAAESSESANEQRTK